MIEREKEGVAKKQKGQEEGRKDRKRRIKRRGENQGRGEGVGEERDDGRGGEEMFNGDEKDENDEVEKE